MDRSCRPLHGQPRQPFECNYFPLLTGRIVLSNKKRNWRKYSVVFFITFLKRKSYLADPIFILTILYVLNCWNLNWKCFEIEGLTILTTNFKRKPQKLVAWHDTYSHVNVRENTLYVWPNVWVFRVKANSCFPNFDVSLQEATCNARSRYHKQFWTIN